MFLVCVPFQSCFFYLKNPTEIKILKNFKERYTKNVHSKSSCNFHVLLIWSKSDNENCITYLNKYKNLEVDIHETHHVENQNSFE